MVVQFIGVMTKQVHKHNQQYLCTASLVGSVFSEFMTGQIVARLLRGGMDEIPVLESNLFDSKIHNQPVDLPKFESILADMIPDECWKHPATTFFSKEIDQIADGLDIWAD
jgi:hypothetical protein